MSDGNVTTKKPDDVVLPCGCMLSFEIIHSDQVMRIAPCRGGCPNLATMLELAEDGQVPVVRRVGP